MEKEKKESRLKVKNERRRKFCQNVKTKTSDGLKADFLSPREHFKLSTHSFFMEKNSACFKAEKKREVKKIPGNTNAKMFPFNFFVQHIRMEGISKLAT